jgi:hypothetical protein
MAPRCVWCQRALLLPHPSSHLKLNICGTRNAAQIAQLLADDSGGHDLPLGLIEDARFALLHERWHGTHEFYFDHTRRPIVKRIRCLALSPFRIR